MRGCCGQLRKTETDNSAQCKRRLRLRSWRSRFFAGSAGSLAEGRSPGPRPLDIGTRMCERSAFYVPPRGWLMTGSLNGAPQMNSVEQPWSKPLASRPPAALLGPAAPARRRLATSRSRAGRVRHPVVIVGQGVLAPAAIAALPSSCDHRLSVPNSPRHSQRRRVKRCRLCSCVKPIALCS